MSGKVGWTRAAFGDVVRQVKDRVGPEESGLERYVAGEHMDSDDLRIRRWGTIGDGYLGPAFHMRFQPGHVLYGSRRTYLRKVAVADFAGITANTTFVLEPKDPGVLRPELLPFVMQTEAFHEHAIKQSKGSVNPYINFSDLTWFEFLLPPFDEQPRIAETVMSMDQCREQQLILRAETERVIGSLLDGMWSRHRLVKIARLVESGVIEPPQDGNHGEKHPKASDYVKSGVPFLMASDLRDGRVDLNSCKKISLPLARGLRIGFAKAGDILLSHKGTVGAVARLTELAGEFVMLTPQVTYYRVLDRGRLHPDWLFFCFKSPAFQRSLERASKQSTRAYIGITAQQDLEIPYCPVEEQEAFLDILSKLERTATATERRTAELCMLRQSALHRIFAGA